MRVTGSVKWFNESKGYGWICRDDGCDDVFVHVSALSTRVDNGRPTLVPGQRVTFDIVPGTKSPRAADVRIQSAIDDLSAKDLNA